MSQRPIDRIERELGDGVVDGLIGLSGADLTSLLLEVMRRRAVATDAARVLRQYRNDRFVAPGEVDGRLLHDTEAVLLAAVPDAFEAVVLAPVVPIGIHSTVAGVSQNNVVSTVRRTDVAADPTAGLALEAVVRRAESSGPGEPVRLGGIQRVVRAQAVSGPVSFAHFTLMGLVTAGRDIGDLAFEREALVEHCAALVGSVVALEPDEITLTVSDWTGRLDGVIDTVVGLVDDDRVRFEADPLRTRGRGYYEVASLDVGVRFGDTAFSVGDGGFVDWSRQLLGNDKERLMISGLGIDRLAIGRG
jgi:hypothetical protein